jgi:hypothetical protein
VLQSNKADLEFSSDEASRAILKMSPVVEAAKHWQENSRSGAKRDKLSIEKFEAVRLRQYRKEWIEKTVKLITR